jgi:pilus assembly protein CpaC
MPLRADAMLRALPRVGLALLLQVGTAAAQTVIEQGPQVSSIPAPPFIKIAPTQPVRRLTLAVGKSSIVDLPGDASEVFIGNPGVANAVVRSTRKMFIMGVANGQTTIFALDKAGNQIATLELTVGRDTSELSAIFRTALPGNDIRVQTVDDTIILTGTVQSAVEAQRAIDIANAFVNYTAVGGGSAASGGSGNSISFGSTQVVSGKLINSLVIRDRDQVMLKVQVVEVQRAVLKQLGVSLTGNWNNAGYGLGSVQNPTLSSQVGAGAFGGAGRFATLDPTQGYNGALIAGHIASTVRALERNGVAHVLAEPTVSAISGESAKFTAGGSIPVATAGTIDPTTGRCTVTTTQQNYGVTLNFTPVVLSEGRISLHLATEVSEPDGTQSAAAPNLSPCANLIGFRTRLNETTVELPSGGSIVSAGLIQQNSKQAIAGIPGLISIPILGALFRSRDYQREESELMIVVTPYITKTLAPNQITRPDDGLADAADPQSVLLGRINRIYSTADNPDLIRNYRGRVGFIND